MGINIYQLMEENRKRLASGNLSSSSGNKNTSAQNNSNASSWNRTTSAQNNSTRQQKLFSIEDIVREKGLNSEQEALLRRYISYYESRGDGYDAEESRKRAGVTEKQMDGIEESIKANPEWFEAYKGNKYAKTMNYLLENSNRHMNTIVNMHAFDEPEYIGQWEAAVQDYISRADERPTFEKRLPELEARQKELEDELARIYETPWLKGQSSKSQQDELRAVKSEIEQIKTGLWVLDNEEKYSGLSENADFEEKSIGTMADQLEADKWWQFGRYENQYMTEEEKANYNYLYNTQGKKAAREYLNYLEYALNERETMAELSGHKDMQNGTFWQKAGAQAASVGGTALGFAGIIDAAAQNVGNTLREDFGGKYRPVDYNTLWQLPAQSTSVIRGQTEENIEDRFGTIQIDEGKHPVAAQIFGDDIGLGDLYQAGMSSIDSALIGGALNAISPGARQLAKFVLGGTAATSSVQDAKARGASDEQALTLGITIGAIEALTERYSIENLLNMDSTSILKSMAMQGLVEASEEGAASVADTIADALIMAEKSNWNTNIQSYIDDGYSKEEATKKAFLDAAIEAGWDMVAGFASGAPMGVVSGTANKIGANYAAKQLQKEEQAVIEAYKDSVNDSLVSAVEATKANPNEFHRYQISPVSEREEADVSSLLGGDFTGFTNNINTNGIQHILNRHGENGEQDSSMSDVNDIARVGYVLENYDSVEVMKNEDGTIRYSTGYTDKNNAPSPMLRFSKKVNGTYYVAEAVVDNNYKKFWVVSAYINKNGAVTQVSDASAPEITPEAPLASPALDGSIAQTVEQVNSEEEAPTLEAMQEVTAEENARNTAAQEATQTTAEQTEAKNIPQGNNASETAQTTQEISVTETEEAPTLESLSTKYGAQAKAMVATYKQGQDIRQFDRAYGLAYDMGKAGVSESYAMGSEWLSYLDEDQRKFAYRAGQSAARMQAEEAEKTVKGKATGTTVRKKGVVKAEGVTLEEMRRNFNDPQRKAYSVLRNVAEATGIDIVLYSSATNKDGKFEGEEGKFVKREPGKLYIDINAGISNVNDVNDLDRYTMLRTFSHEFTHFIEHWNPVRYNEFRSVVFRTMEERGENVNDLIEEMQNRTGLDYEAASREVVAEAMTDILPDANFVQTLAEKHKSIFQKILEKLKEFAAKLKEYFGSIAANDSREAAALKETVDGTVKYLDSIVKLFDNIAVEAVEAYQATITGEEVATKETADNETQYSYGGRNARTADLEALSRAEDLEKQNVASDIIFRETGWFRGADGKWRFEIDDSGMKYHMGGDAAFTRNHPDYAEYRNLLNQMLVGSMSEADEAKLRELDDIWGREYPRLSERVKRGNAVLEDILDHEALFQAYPELRRAKVSFGELDSGEAGAFYPGTNTIVLNEKYRNQWPEGTLIHEIQHAIQKAEGFTPGASPEYWARRDYENGDSARERLQREHDRKFGALSRENQNRYVRYQELDDRLGQLFLSEPGTAEARRYDELEAEQDALYEELWPNEWFRELLELKRRADNSAAEYRQMYRNTAGEIEARDAATRRTWDTQRRRNTIPDTGNENTVFADDGGWSYSLVGKTEDGVEVYETSDAVKALPYKDRMSQFVKIMQDEYRGRTAKFTASDGNVYYAAFDGDDIGKNIYGDKKSSPRGWRAKINTGADGNIFELVENARHDGGRSEKGKNSNAHKGVSGWEYFVKTVQIDGRVFDLLANVRKKPDGEYVYSIQLNDNKNKAPAPPLASTYGRVPAGSAQNGVLTNASTNSIPQTEEKGNTKISEQSRMRTPALTDRDILEAAYDRVDSMELTAGERDALRIFRERLDKLHELQETRFALGSTYKEQMFTKGGDRAEAQKTLNRMHILDEQVKRASAAVLSIEDKAVLQRVLQQARKVVEAEERQKSKESLARWRSRKYEAEDIRKYRGRIKADSDELSKWLTKPDNKTVVKHVPEALRKPVVDFISSIDFTSKRQLRGGEATKADKAFIKKLEAVKAAVRDGDVDEMYLPEEFGKRLDDLVDKMRAISDSDSGEFVINQMTASELKELSSVVRTLKKLVTDYNKFHANAMYEHVYEAADSTISYTGKMAKASGKEGKLSDYLLWKIIRPATAFERFGKGGVAILDGFKNGQNKLAFNTKKIVAFAEKTYTTEEVRTWEKEIKTFDIGGEKVRMTVAQVMAFYELTKRPDALRHILNGGIRAATHKDGREKIYHEGSLITPEDIETITGSLTERQRTVADALQKYMAKQGGKWGNEVSMARFGEEQFTDEHYFPISSDGVMLPAEADETPSNTGLYALLNMSFTKQPNDKANNRLVVYSIFDVFANHMGSMAQYNALALPVLDALKWLNYKQRDEAGNITYIVREEMRRVYGAKEESKSTSTGYAEKFVTNIIRSYNGTSAQGSAEDTEILNLVKRGNYAAVAFNARVVVQQPMSFLRAGLVLDYKSFAKALTLKPKAVKTNIREMQEHSGIAVWKNLGFYDVNISRGLSEIIKHSDTWLDKVNEFGMWGAENADLVTWGWIWGACKIEVINKNGIKPGDAGFYDAVTKRFEDVIYKTQVVDSVLTKNDYLRSKGWVPRTLGSFMSEPTTTASMLIDAYDKFYRDRQRGMSFSEAWKKNGKNIGRTAWVYSLSAAALAAVQAVMDGFRDDDDYETFSQKWYDAFKSNLHDELMVFNKVPIGKEFYGGAKMALNALGVDTYGNVSDFGISRLINDFVEVADRAKKVFVEKTPGYTTYYFASKGFQAISSVSGVPLGSVTRELVTAWNAIVGPMAPSLKVQTYDPGTKRSIQYSFEDGYLTEAEAVEAYIKDAGMEKEEAEAHVAYLAFKRDNGDRYDKITESKYNDYIEAGADGVINLSVYNDAIEVYNGTHDTEDKEKKELFAEYVNKLKLTAKQKTALYRCFYQEKTTEQNALW